MYSDNYALVDCNNFFVSCERVFNPKLRNKPVAVLSNNDGCVIARSNELKALGVPMGEPVFKLRELIDKHGVMLCSSNFSLYQDMSERVFRALAEFCEQIEIYSVDEAFLRFNWINQQRNTRYLHDITDKVYQWTGIPVSIGLAKTKTTAKLANKIAKKFSLYKNSFEIQDIYSIEVVKYLTKIDLDDIWGIGYRIARTLKTYNINTIPDFLSADPRFLRQRFGVQLERTWKELHGTRCYPISTHRSSKKGILCSRTFKQAYTSYKQVEEAISTYCARASASLRKQNSLAGTVTIFITTGRFAKAGYFTASREINLDLPTSDTPIISKAGINGLKQIYSPEHAYKRAGVFLSNFFTDNNVQRNMFVEYDIEGIKRSRQTMSTVDELNSYWGKDTVKFANQRINKPVIIEQSIRSDRYTTNWDELLVVRSS